LAIWTNSLKIIRLARGRIRVNRVALAVRLNGPSGAALLDGDPRCVGPRPRIVFHLGRQPRHEVSDLHAALDRPQIVTVPHMTRPQVRDTELPPWLPVDGQVNNRLARVNLLRLVTVSQRRLTPTLKPEIGRAHV